MPPEICTSRTTPITASGKSPRTEPSHHGCRHRQTRLQRRWRSRHGRDAQRPGPRFPGGLRKTATSETADTGNNRIREVSNGTSMTIAGNGNAGYSGDNGAATSATR